MHYDTYCPNQSLHWIFTPLRFVKTSELKRSPLAPLGENVAVKPELLFPFAPLRENQEFKTDAPSGHGLTATLCRYVLFRNR